MSGLQRALSPMLRRVMSLVSRAVVERVSDGTRMQGAQVSLLDDEVRDNVERFQNYGFTSVPEAGAEGVAVCVGGNRDHVILVAVDDRRYRKVGLLAGEVAVYTKWGDVVLLKQGEIQITHATKVTITAPTVQINGNLLVSGNVTATGNVADQGGAKTMAGMRTAYGGHKHTETGAITNGPDTAM